jgi:hypothetical protein
MSDIILNALIEHHTNDYPLQDIAINHTLFVNFQGWIVVYELFGAAEVENTTNCAFVNAGKENKVIWSKPVVK